jgi:hypothetical protein
MDRNYGVGTEALTFLKLSTWLIFMPMGVQMDLVTNSQ